MTFFLQGKRNTDFPTNDSPSPFQYSYNNKRNKSHGYAPFNSTSRLNRSTKKQQKKFQPQRNIDEEKIFTIDQNLLKAQIQDKMSSMFKSRSQRFIHLIKNVPGPGSYELRGKNNKAGNRKKIESYSMNYSTVQKKITNPSMPIDNLGYKVDKQQKLMKVNPKQTKAPVPGSYDIRQDLIKSHGYTWKNQQTISRKQEDQPQPGPGHYTDGGFIKKAAVSSCFYSTTSRFNQMRSKRAKAPGPGDYNPQVRPFRQFSESHFNTKSRRFASTKQDNVGPGSYNLQKSKSVRQFSKNNKQLQKNPYRNTLFNAKNLNPGPGQYIARDGMTFQLQKALLRKHNLSQFPNTKRELFQQKLQQEPGPGSYNPETLHSTNKHNIGYKKAQIVNLKQGQEEYTPSPFDYSCNQHTIQKRIEQSNKKLTLTDRKPFNSGASRFKHYQNTINKPQQRHMTYDTDNQSVDTDQRSNSNNFDDTRRTKKLIMTSVKVKVPFGSSSSKYQDIHSANNVCPGYYDETSQPWLKQTFSIKGKLSNKQ